MFYLYRQNNSGGGFGGPALYIVAEADNPKDANKLAKKHGAYFNGVDKELDCDCCGDRWYKLDATEPDGWQCFETLDEALNRTGPSFVAPKDLPVYVHVKALDGEK